MSRLRSRQEHSPKENHLLAALPAADLARLLPHLALKELPLGMVLQAPGEQLRHLYFPTAGVVSLLYVLEDGHSAEIAVVGNDGCVGVATLLGGGSSPAEAIVQVAGYAYEVGAATILNEFRRAGPLQSSLLRYIQALTVQISQTAVCNRHHTLEQQLCRVLLLILDRAPSNELVLTQELISNMLGVRRSGITRAARTLLEAGLIKYRRGHVTVSDRAKLEAHACECYAVVRKETQRLLSLEPA